jgi:phospholipid-binding lipoprotein MlaA
MAATGIRISTKNGTKTGLTALAVVALLALGACASPGGGRAIPPKQSAAASDNGEISDPLERMNRATFAFNDVLDRALIEPVTRGYRAIVPHPLRMGVRNFLRNLRSPVNVANQILQGDIEGGASDVARFAVNTTIGVGGLFDVAKDMGLPYEYEDFGQTLGTWGVGQGPYLVIPVLGPSTFRDAAGLAVDSFADPVRIYLYNTDQEGWDYARIIMTGIDTREQLLDAINDLRRNSIDYYAAMRSTYGQHRAAQVRDEAGDSSMAPSVVIPDYDAEDAAARKKR